MEQTYITAALVNATNPSSRARRRLSELRAAIQIHAQCARDDALGASLREFTLLRELVQDADAEPELWPIIDRLSRVRG